MTDNLHPSATGLSHETTQLPQLSPADETFGIFIARSRLRPRGAWFERWRRHVDGISMVEIGSAPRVAMGNDADQSIAREIAPERRTSWAWKLSAAATAVVVCLLFVAKVSSFAIWLSGLSGTLATLACSIWEGRARTVTLTYNLSSEAATAYCTLQDVLQSPSRLGRVWHITALGVVRNRKYYGGASRVLKRASIAPELGAPANVRTNVDVPRVRLIGRSLYFFPDYLVIVMPEAAAAVPYDEIRVELRSARFAETGRVPDGSEIIGATWRYPNKDKGQDMRFAENPRLPIVLYEEVRLSSANGLHEILQVSCHGFGERLRKAIQGLAALRKSAVSRTMAD